jgi:hypothetical protein
MSGLKKSLGSSERKKLLTQFEELEMRATASDILERSLDLTIPYYFSSVARDSGEALRIGDQVRVRGLENKFELLDIVPRESSVTVREVHGFEAAIIPWDVVMPWRRDVIKSTAITQAIGDWLFLKHRVYRLKDPARMLKQLEINWNQGTCDVEDEDGNVFYGIPWKELEFVDQIYYHPPEK